ncbi:MAG: ATP-binding protein [Syntrophobacteraceae bacterium]|nr:PAS domain S-box protein [Desulfobacteraceae bacterium]
MDLLKSCCSSVELWEDLLSSIQQVILVSNLEGTILFASTTSDKELGYTPRELTGRDLSLIFTREDLDCLYPNLLYLVRNDRAFEGELMLVRSDGTRFMAFMVVRPGFDPDEGRPIAIVTIQNIDKLKHLEKIAPTTYYQDLVKIASGIAHEIRNPLVGVGGFVNRLVKTCDISGDAGRYYQVIMSNLSKIDNLIRKVEFFSQLPRPDFAEAPLVGVIDEALLPYMLTIEEHKVGLETRVDGTVLCVDRNLLARAVSILVENALDAMPDGGRITITNEVKGSHCFIHVQDTGKGIAAGDLPFVFNPFFSTKSDGAGIDLAVVKRIVESHGGSVEVRSNRGEGATFVLRFPMERRRRIRVSLLEELEPGGDGSGSLSP